MKRKINEDAITSRAEKQYKRWKDNGAKIWYYPIGKLDYQISELPPGEYTVVEGDEDGRRSFPQFNIRLMSKMNIYDLAIQIASKTGWINPWGYLELQPAKQKNAYGDNVFPLEPTLFDENKKTIKESTLRNMIRTELIKEDERIKGGYRGERATRNSVQQMIDYLLENPFSTEQELQVGTFDYDKNNAFQSDKKYKDMLRRGLASGKIDRVEAKVKGKTARFFYYIPK